MTEREWLAMQGLAIAGARGKFSHKAKAALAKAYADGIDIASLEYQPTAKTVTKQKTEPNVIKKISIIKPAEKVRDNDIMWAIDRGTKPGMSDLVIAITNCGGCGKTISRCTHDSPLLPNWLGGGVGLLIKP